jgi:3-methyladenine DNA glycosylase AlkD
MGLNLLFDSVLHTRFNMPVKLELKTAKTLRTQRKLTLARLASLQFTKILYLGVQSSNMSVEKVLAELKALGSESIKKVLLNHGAQEPFYGVKVGDMKPIQKREKGNQTLAMELYKSGISDAMYLAGLIADGNKMSKAELQEWAKAAYWNMLSEYTVPWVAVESKFAEELADEWIKSDDENIACAGWNTWSGIVSIKKDEELNITKLKELIKYIEKNIHKSQNRVRYCMNGFIISAGAYVKELTEDAKKAANQIGKVNVNMGATACNVPEAVSYIEKSIERGSLTKKKKTMKC